MTPHEHEAVTHARQRAHRMGAFGSALLVVGCASAAVAATHERGLVVLGSLVLVAVGAALASAAEDLLRRLPR